MFTAQEAQGFDVWRKPLTPLAWPHVFNLRADPFERAHDESIGWAGWATQRMFAMSGAQAIAMEFLETFLDYPPRQEPGAFSVDGIMRQLEQARVRDDGPRVYSGYDPMSADGR